MHLQRKFFLGVEKFDQQRKSRRLRNVTENVMSILRPEFVQCFSVERWVRDDTPCLRAIDDFPRFADANIRRQLFSELRLETASAPHSFHEDRLEGEGRCEIRLAHAAISGTVAAAAPPAP